MTTHTHLAISLPPPLPSHLVANPRGNYCYAVGAPLQWTPRKKETRMKAAPPVLSYREEIRMFKYTLLDSIYIVNSMN